MASLNQVTIIGNLGRDPETRTFPSGDQITNVTIATTDKWKDKQSGEMREATEWHRVTFNGRTAEVAAQYLRKGSQVCVQGSLRTRKYKDKDGVEKYATEIRADNLVMLGGGEGRTSGPAAAPARAPAQPSRAPAAAPRQSSGFDDMDDDIPFATNSPYFDETTSKQRRMAARERF